ncbi:hypothetical protein [Paucisalibacillus sp. EB02]|uniref:hypothetical protein n=1 Tax=Paucisalibacillus sp. EB02 TaxID=1347087 RepID=UPI0005AA8926|nr:hypothetical protein [Paucisalibacillus sp. EB02]
MKVLLVLGSIIFPLLMYVLKKKWVMMRVVFNLSAIISSLVFGNIAASSIYQIIKDNTVLMTNIHAIFLNPYFLITGSYLGIYSLYLLLVLMEENLKG